MTRNWKLESETSENEDTVDNDTNSDSELPTTNRSKETNKRCIHVIDDTDDEDKLNEPAQRANW